MDIDTLYNTVRGKVSDGMNAEREAWLARRPPTETSQICGGRVLQITHNRLAIEVEHYETILDLVIDAMKHASECAKVGDASDAAEFAVETAKKIYDLG